MELTSIGAIVGDCAVTGIYSAGTMVSADCLTCYAVGMDGRRTLLPGRSTEQNATSAISSLEAKLGEPRKASLAVLQRKDFCFGLPEGPVKSIQVTVRENGAERSVPWLAPDFSLAQLLPLTREELRDSFAFLGPGKRHKDAVTVRFTARQILENAETVLSLGGEFIGGYVINAFVNYLYKSMELDEPVPTALFHDMHATVQAALSQLPSGSVSGRENPGQLELSLLTVLWHHEIFIGSMDGLRSVLEKTSRFIDYAVAQSITLRGYNGQKVFLMQGILAARARDFAAAAHSCEQAIDDFERVVASRTRNIDWFKDLAECHRVATAALEMSLLLKKKNGPETKALVKALPIALRIKTPTFLTRARTLLAI